MSNDCDSSESQYNLIFTVKLHAKNADRSVADRNDCNALPVTLQDFLDIFIHMQLLKVFFAFDKT